MRKIIFTVLTLFALDASAQTVDMRRKIEVSGLAEAEVTPDIIYFGVSLKEYMDGKNRIDIDALEVHLQKALAEAGIPKEDLTVNDISGYTSYKKKKETNFLASKQYIVKFHNLKKVNQILSSLDVKGVERTDIVKTEYSKMPELKKELKLKALIAAKEKAEYLLAGIGEKLGRVIDVNEDITNNSYFGANLYANNVAQYESSANSGTANEGVDYKNIKFKFQVKAVFEIAQ